MGLFLSVLWSVWVLGELREGEGSQSREGVARERTNQDLCPKPNLSDFGMSLLSLLEAEFKFQRRGESSVRLIIYKPATGELSPSHLFLGYHGNR